MRPALISGILQFCIPHPFVWDCLNVGTLPKFNQNLAVTVLTFNLHHVGRLDPPLYALSWNLKNSHVFSGSF